LVRRTPSAARNGRENTDMLTGRLCAAALIGAAAITSTPALAQDKVTLKFVTGWDDRFEGTPFVAHRYAKMVQEATNGRIGFRFSGPEVVKPNQQFQPTSAGVFDLMYSTPVYYLGTTGVPFAFFALPPDAALWRKRGYWEYTDKELGRYNQKLIALISGSNASNYYQIVLKEPLKKGDKPFQGMKIRGNIFYKPLVEPLGGSLVNLDGGEIYAALEKGVVNGAAWPVLGAVNFKFNEVAKYMLRPRFGYSPFTLTMNMNSFKKLSKDDQALLLKLGEQIENEVPAKFEKAMSDEVAKLKELGVQETTLDPALFEKVNRSFLKGVWNIAVNFNKKTKARVEALYEMAKKNGDAE
jgi:TRAP-type C4-dicarboxylate transport system substrate-binding protein